jgi:hypothetical protein
MQSFTALMVALQKDVALGGMMTTFQSELDFQQV